MPRTWIPPQEEETRVAVSPSVATPDVEDKPTAGERPAFDRETLYRRTIGQLAACVPGTTGGRAR